MFYLIITSIIWSLSFGLIKSQLTGINPYLVAFLRLVISCLVFLPFLRKLPLRQAATLLAIGAAQFGVMYCLYISSFAYLSAAQVALLTITTPLFVVGWDAILNRRTQRGFWLASTLAVLAAAILVWESSGFEQRLRGLIYLQGANACFALGQVLYKTHVPKGRAHQHFGYLYLGACLVPLGFLLAEGSMPHLPRQPQTWLALAYLGVVASGLGFFLWNQGIRRVSNGVVAVMNNLKIPLGALLAWLLFGEALDLGRWAIAAGVFALAFLPLWRRRG